MSDETTTSTPLVVAGDFVLPSRSTRRRTSSVVTASTGRSPIAGTTCVSTRCR
jgi:hypothetical protein